MSPPAVVRRGAPALRALLEERVHDLRRVDLPGFRRWLGAHLERWERDPVFVQRTRIRELRRATPALRALEAERRRAAEADRAAEHHDRLERLERGISDAGKAIAGLAGALATEDPERHASLQAKLDAFRARRRGLEEEQAALVAASPERRELLRLDAELRRLRAESGIDREEARLEAVARERGRRSGRSGSGFERLALSLAREEILPDLPGGDLRLLRGVRLGGARAEIDLLVVRRASAGAPVEALALIEAKRNPNDLAHGLRLRRENLAWLSGSGSGYDPELYRTRAYPSGRFEGEAVHREGGEAYRFDASSFARLRPAPGDRVPEGLWLVTREAALWGVSSRVLARIAARVATDDRWAPHEDAYLERLLPWCRALAGEVEAPDVLRSYAEDAERARRVLLVTGTREEAG